MGTSVSTLLLHSWTVWAYFLPFPVHEANRYFLGLKQTIQQDGVWKIRKREKSPVIEVIKVEESGHGGILSPAFTEWRSTM